MIDKSIIKKCFGNDYLVHINQSDQTLSDNESCPSITFYIMRKDSAAFVRLYIYNNDLNTAYVESLSVEEDHRMLGIGNNILGSLRDVCIALNIKNLMLWTDETSWVYTWYVKWGFKYHSIYEEPDHVWLIKNIE